MIKICPKHSIQETLVFDEIGRDKSLSHRAIIFALLADTPTYIHHCLDAQDTLATLHIAHQLGAEMQRQGHTLIITPPTSKCLASDVNLQCHNSGTTMRLYMGLLSGFDGNRFYFDGDSSLQKRPMQRIRDFLEPMGAVFADGSTPLYPPFCLQGSKLSALHHISPISSAQSKSAFILAALQAQGTSFYSEPYKSRDHSERLLLAMGAQIKITQNTGYQLTIHPLRHKLRSLDFEIPNDPSSVFFFIVACLISPKSHCIFTNVLLNPTRIYALSILKQMGANITWHTTSSQIEEIGTIEVRSSTLSATTLNSQIAWCIDEIPALCIAFACANGESIIRNAGELRIKESDRLASIAHNLQALGIQVEEYDDGLKITGGEFQQNAKLQSFGDHRIAMAFSLVGIKTQVWIENTECVNISLPNFYQILEHFVELQ
ncbi:3-phosphoshikimate 1-carboxyvinyltransferase [Helicobacter enhydrae]|uniref:3-phosphoshikimate 1-carboxyvinyltransferase n=1 Tax=Helicobacter enhydrae TaxID=222136 RepID=A0A1B1U4S0_9HELI|nr:3-phosphoshikimate 1-carboxyvinyltransferase [Helicobacter enhydrae]ANV97794.1 3-phosphoshikimate 1-carboxyvinyltransferase [Helicobacter enhydrae]